MGGQSHRQSLSRPNGGSTELRVPRGQAGTEAEDPGGGVSSWGSLQTIWAVEELAGAGPGSAWAAVGEAGTAAYF